MTTKSRQATAERQTEVIDVVVLVASDDASELHENEPAPNSGAPRSTLVQLLNGSSDFPGGLREFGTVKGQQGRNLPAENARSAVRVSTANEWVIPTGGGYSFAPSIDASNC
jgi:hypothetical protein